jgi:hypothetical protein
MIYNFNDQQQEFRTVSIPKLILSSVNDILSFVTVSKVALITTFLLSLCYRTVCKKIVWFPSEISNRKLKLFLVEMIFCLLFGLSTFLFSPRY